MSHILPNGERTLATKQGTVSFIGKLKLKHVLFVPNFECSLISVAQLLNDSNYVMHFTNKYCVIQDRISKMLIGAGEQSGGLYCLREAVCALKARMVDSGDIWHRRLGHPSSSINKMLSFVGDLNNKTDVCDICVHAKQVREKFFISNNKATTPFELIHCDLWG